MINNHDYVPASLKPPIADGDGGSPREAPGYNSRLIERTIVRGLTAAGWVAAVLPERTHSRTTVLDRIVIGGIRFYRRHLSQHTMVCRQHPSCSGHAVWAVGRYGWQIGLQVVAARIQKCAGPSA